jgi:hypothetical protein
MLLAWPPAPVVADDMASIETESLRLIYFDPTETYLAPYVARCFTTSLAAQRQRFGFEQDGKVTVLLKDFADYGNASAGAVPRNTLLIDIAPISFSYETFAPSERMYTLMNHELVHVAMMDQASSQDRTARRWLGGKVTPVAEHPETILLSYLTAPRIASPRWYLEGSAVFMETWMARGLGRGQGAYDEMVFRAMVRDDAHFYDPLGLVSEGTRIDFQVGVNAYLYGTRFMSYLAYRDGPERLLEWWTRPDGSRRSYSAQFQHVYGQSLDDAWQQWIAFEHDYQEANLAEIRKVPTTPYRDVLQQGLGSVSRVEYDAETGVIYAGVRYPGIVSHIAALDVANGTMRRLVDIKEPMLYQVTSLAFDPRAKTIYYTTDNQAYRDLVALDVRTGATRRLIRDARIGDLAFNRADGSLWGVRHLNGFATLVRMPAPHTSWTQVHTFPYGQTLYDLDVSPDGARLSASFGDVSGEQTLRVWSIDALLAGDAAPMATRSFGSAAPEAFRFSADGRVLQGSSYYTGVSNIFRYDPASDRLEALSNAETGFFRPVALDGDRMLVMRYSGQGFVPAVIDARPLEDLSAVRFLGTQIAEKHPVVKEWGVASPASVPLDSLVTHEGPYRALSNVSLETVHPIVEGYKDSAAFGFRAHFSDPIAWHNFDATATFSPDSALESDEQWHARLLYEHLGFSADLRYNYANFYDLFGPSKESLKGHSITLGYDWPLIYDKPRRLDLSIEASYYGGLERVPAFQDIEASFDELTHAAVGLEYENVYRSLGAVDDEKGWRWTAHVGANYVDGEAIPYFYGSLDLGVALPLHNSSVWLLSAAGIADGDEDNPFANFFFGGFQNNWVDYREVKRYREPFTMAGFDINELGGQTFVKSVLEWNLPPVRFREAGKPGFYASFVRPALFASALVTDVDDERPTYGNVGAQLDLQLHVLSRLDMTVSIGYARGFGADSVGEDEFMLSLKIL